MFAKQFMCNGDESKYEKCKMIDEHVLLKTVINIMNKNKLISSVFSLISQITDRYFYIITTHF